MSKENCVTFTEPCYVIFDVDAGMVRTTAFGHIAIFSTRNVAEAIRKQNAGNLEVIPVWVTPVEKGKN